MDGLGFLLDAPYVASPHHELDAPILSLDTHHMVLDDLVLGLGFHGEVSLVLFHHPLPLEKDLSSNPMLLLPRGMVVARWCPSSPLS